nr:RHS repeat-associated core domain-containing protein [Pseudomonas syringae]
MTTAKEIVVFARTLQCDIYSPTATLPINQIDNPLRFHGQYFAAETGLHYDRHRYYNPGTGRFLTPDPIKLAGGLNNYQYVPNPTGWVDPLGLDNCPGGPSCTPSNVVEDPFAKSIVDEGQKVPEVAQAKPDFYVGPSGLDSTMPSTGYRYMRYQHDDGTVDTRALGTLKTKSAPVTYAGFEKFDTGSEARKAFQVKGPEVGPDSNGKSSWSDARLSGTFDKLQFYVDGKPDARTLFRKGDEDKTKLEPFVHAYPEYGDGGAQQIHTNSKVIYFDEVEVLPEKQ